MTDETLARAAVRDDLSVPDLMTCFGIGRTTARRIRAIADGILLGASGPEPLDILVVGDQHVTPGRPVEHFEWLAALVRDRKPDVIVNVGDVIDNVSMSFHATDAQKAEFNYMQELSAGVDAWGPVVRAAKDVGARLVVTLGNHDDQRLKRVLTREPWLRGAIKEIGPMLAEDGWEVFDFQVPAVIGGVAFAHYWVSGVMGRPIGGVNPARAMAMKLLDSALGGHSHVYNVRTTNSATGRKLLNGTVGCFIHPGSDVSDWAGPQTKQLYDVGIVYLHRVKDGHGDVEWMGFDRLKLAYED